jgi:hypothetical protein
MAVTARLFIKGHAKEEKGIRVISCDFSFSQPVDEDGLPRSSVRAGLINITITGVNDVEIVDWMIIRGMRKNGKISFLGINESGVQQETKALEFEDAFCVEYRESFTDQTEVLINLSLSARKISLSNSTYETQWDVFDSK